MLITQQSDTERQVLGERKELYRGSQQSQGEGGLLFQMANSTLLMREQEFFCFVFFPFIYISWRLITLQYYSGFCHTLT